MIIPGRLLSIFWKSCRYHHSSCWWRDTHTVMSVLLKSLLVPLGFEHDKLTNGFTARVLWGDLAHDKGDWQGVLFRIRESHLIPTVFTGMGRTWAVIGRSHCPQMQFHGTWIPSFACLSPNVRYPLTFCNICQVYLVGVHDDEYPNRL